MYDILSTSAYLNDQHIGTSYRREIYWTGRKKKKEQEEEILLLCLCPPSLSSGSESPLNHNISKAPSKFRILQGHESKLPQTDFYVKQPIYWCLKCLLNQRLNAGLVLCNLHCFTLKKSWFFYVLTLNQNSQESVAD